MKIAFISFEYPPDTANGGIATYVRQAARMFSQRGHTVEVFAASPHRSGFAVEDGIPVQRVIADSWQFAERIGPVFQRRHQEQPFDVLEGPEMHAEAREAVRLVPDMPAVVKLHTPYYLFYRLNHFLRLRDRAGLILYALRTRQRPPWHPLFGKEPQNARDADEVAAPCRAIGELCTRDWNLDRERVALVPYPYTPSEEMLRIPVDTCTQVISFLGRLERRKGVLDLAEAIPRVLKRHPRARFRFIGRPMQSPQPGVDMRQYLQDRLLRYRESVEFLEAVPLDSIPAVLAQTDICIFPSLWENFPNVCLEAMSAGRGVVGSSAGGMADMLDEGRAGLLVPPHSPQRIADAIGALLDDPARRMQFGEIARSRVLSEYHADRILALQEASYRRAIERRRRLGKREARTRSHRQ